MNGRVVAVLVKPGEKVAAGQPVMTLEAMKMEHVHTAGVAGTVSAIDVAEGEQVTTGKIVVEIEAQAQHLGWPQAKREPGPIPSGWTRWTLDRDDLCMGPAFAGTR